MSDTPKLISISEASKRYGLSARTLRRWCKQGRVAACRFGKLWYIDRHELQYRINNEQA